MSRAIRLFIISILSVFIIQACATHKVPKTRALNRDINRVTVPTSLGPVAGIHNTEGIDVFLGIPYAKPPVGERRFIPPQEPDKWSNTFPALNFSPVCPQIHEKLEPSSYMFQDEDCLTLNIWTPSADSSNRPVVVFIHGGGFITGSSSNELYDGANLAWRGNIVVVSINYRLGALGFLYLSGIEGGDPLSGNIGMLDQIKALRWVRDNISSFGGDPSKVTIMGESAGSMSVTTLMAMPDAKSLFSKVIAESGAPNLSRTREQAKKITTQFMEIAGSKDLQSLRSLPIEKVLDAQKKILHDAGFSAEMTFTPTIDGIAITKDPFVSISDGSAEGITLLVGTNKDEFRFFLHINPMISLATPKILLGLAPDIAKKLGDKADKIIDTYRDYFPRFSRGELAMQIAGDIIFWIPSIRLAEAQLNHGRVYMYMFSWESPVDGGKYGAQHAIELPFVFYNHRLKGLINFIGENPPERLAQEISDSWISFVKTGNPSTPDLPAWPVYNLEKRPVMNFNLKSALQNDPNKELRLVFKDSLY